MNLLDCELAGRQEISGFQHRRTSVREALGGELIGCSLYELPPGEQLWPYHFHWNNEEWLIVVSGRVSFEIVQKTVAAGAAGIVAVSAPSSLAVDLCRTHGLVLAGLVRDGHLNLYAGAELVR